MQVVKQDEMHRKARGKWRVGGRWLCVLPLAPLGLLCGVILLLAGCSGPTAGWQPLSHTSDATFLVLAADPSQKQMVYAGATDGNVYLLHADEPGTPVVAGGGIPKNTAIASLLPDPHTAGLVYAGTSAGLYVTKDSSVHWSARGVGFPAGDSMDALAFGQDASTLFAGSTQHGVYVSHDAGATWQPAGAGLPTHANINALLWDSIGHVIYTAVDGAGIYASADGGQTWTQHTSGISSGINVHSLAELPKSDPTETGPTLFAGTSRGVYTSTDGGQSWSADNTGLPVGQVFSLATDPNIPGWIYAGTMSTVYRSADSGHDWSLVAPGLAHQVSSIAAVPSSASHYVVYAAAGQIVRFPPGNTGGNITSTILTVIIVALLIGLLYYSSRRAHRALTFNTSGARVRPGASGQSGSPTAGNGTLRGIPSRASGDVASRIQAHSSRQASLLRQSHRLDARDGRDAGSSAGTDGENGDRQNGDRQNGNHHNGSRPCKGPTP